MSGRHHTVANKVIMFMRTSQPGLSAKNVSLFLKLYEEP